MKADRVIIPDAATKTSGRRFEDEPGRKDGLVQGGEVRDVHPLGALRHTRRPVEGIKGEVKRAYFLAEPDRAVELKREGDKLILTGLPPKPIDQYDTVVVLEMEG